MDSRSEILLRACLDLLRRQKDSVYVLDLLREKVFYDDCYCDGYCLMEDISSYLEIGE